MRRQIGLWNVKTAPLRLHEPSYIELASTQLICDFKITLRSVSLYVSFENVFDHFKKICNCIIIKYVSFME